jgi:phosphoribosylglycinamide formyltransferase
MSDEVNGICDANELHHRSLVPLAMAPARLTVLISGSGTNLQAIIDACNSHTLIDTTVVRVISDRKDAYGLKRAETAGIATRHHGVLPYKKQYPDTSSAATFSQARQAYDADLAKFVLEDAPDLVVCAGFMRILAPSFLNPLQDANVPIINLHPAMHGDLVGADCIERAWKEYEAGKRKETGVMIHYVIAEVDMGEPICQKRVPMEGCADVTALKDRIHKVEHGLIVQGAGLVIEQRRRTH